MNVSLIRQQLHTIREALKEVREPTVITIHGCLSAPGEAEGIA
jgi:hypothetical protein